MFQGCSLLSYVKLPSTATKLISLFSSCTNLEHVIIPDNVAELSYNVFFNCRSLTHITIPERVTSITGATFQGCVGLKEIHLKPTTPPTLGSTSAFSGIRSDAVFYVPAGSLNAYQTATNWSTYASKMQEE